MPRFDYIFVDESGDPAFKLNPTTGQLLSSDFYVAAALHLCDDSFRDLNKTYSSIQVLLGTQQGIENSFRKRGVRQTSRSDSRDVGGRQEHLGFRGLP